MIQSPQSSARKVERTCFYISVEIVEGIQLCTGNGPLKHMGHLPRDEMPTNFKSFKQKSVRTKTKAKGEQQIGNNKI